MSSSDRKSAQDRADQRRRSRSGSQSRRPPSRASRHDNVDRWLENVVENAMEDLDVELNPATTLMTPGRRPRSASATKGRRTSTSSLRKVEARKESPGKNDLRSESMAIMPSFSRDSELTNPRRKVRSSAQVSQPVIRKPSEMKQKPASRSSSRQSSVMERSDITRRSKAPSPEKTSRARHEPFKSQSRSSTISKKPVARKESRGFSEKNSIGERPSRKPSQKSMLPIRTNKADEEKKYKDQKKDVMKYTFDDDLNSIEDLEAELDMEDDTDDDLPLEHLEYDIKDLFLDMVPTNDHEITVMNVEEDGEEGGEEGGEKRKGSGKSPSKVRRKPSSSRKPSQVHRRKSKTANAEGEDDAHSEASESKPRRRPSQRKSGGASRRKSKTDNARKDEEGSEASSSPKKRRPSHHDRKPGRRSSKTDPSKKPSKTSSRKSEDDAGSKKDEEEAPAEAPAEGQVQAENAEPTAAEPAEEVAAEEEGSEPGTPVATGSNVDARSSGSKTGSKAGSRTGSNTGSKSGSAGSKTGPLAAGSKTGSAGSKTGPLTAGSNADAVATESGSKPGGSESSLKKKKSSKIHKPECRKNSQKQSDPNLAQSGTFEPRMGDSQANVRKSQSGMRTPGTYSSGTMQNYTDTLPLYNASTSVKYFDSSRTKVAEFKLLMIFELKELGLL